MPLDSHHLRTLSPPADRNDGDSSQHGWRGLALQGERGKGKFETRATPYGIIVGLDYLERAYVRDAVTAAECASLFPLSFVRSHVLMGRYSPTCTRLLSQYKMMSKLAEEDVPSIEQFMSQYRVGNVAGHAHA